MKTRKNKIATTPASEALEKNASRGLSLSDALNQDFDAFCAVVYPDEFGNQDDRQILRSVWHAATRQAVARITQSCLVPMNDTAKAEFELIVPANPAAPAV